MKISIVGTGYVGLVTGICLAELGHNVLCIDSDKDKISQLKKGISPIIEKGINSALKKTISSNNISFSDELSLACNFSDVIFIAVGTPTKSDSNDADLSILNHVLSEIKNYANRTKVIVIKSTVPIGTNDHLSKLYPKESSNLLFISNPEFLREGNALFDARNPDRIVIGGVDENSIKKVKSIYRSFKNKKIVVTDPTSSELIKYASNAFLASKISFINEIASIALKVNASISDITHGMGLDPRIGNLFLKPGPGYGGSCFPKDVKAIDFFAKEKNLHLPIISNIEVSNLIIKKKILERIKMVIGKRSKVKDKIITIFGVSFKPDTDDVRDSASVYLIKNLTKLGLRIKLYDPILSDTNQIPFKNSEWHSSAYDAVLKSQLLIIMNDSREFLNLKLKNIASSMQSKRIMDLRNLFNVDDLSQAGFEEVYNLDKEIVT